LQELPRLSSCEKFIASKNLYIAGHLLIKNGRAKLKIRNSNEWVSLPIETVRPYGRQIRRHDRRKIAKLKKLIGHFGQVAPIIIDANRVIIDGFATWRAMSELGSGDIATITVAGRTDPEIKALRLALNRLPADTAWDNQELRAEFEELIKISFDLDLTAFDTAEIDHVLDMDLPKANVVEDEEQIPAVQTQAISKLGDIWICDDHRLGCGNAHDGEFVARLRDGALADVCFTDPPYNVHIAGFVSGKGRNQHREFVQGTGEMSSEDFTTFLATALKVLQTSSSPRALLFICMDWRHVHELISAGRQCVLELYNICVWAKTNAGMGSLYRNQHELICVFKVGAEPPTNNVELGRHGRNRSNLWTYRGLNAFGNERDELLAAHPTVKPVAMIADALRDVTKRSGIVLDTFLGSGSTLIAAEETGRRCLGVELDPLYVDVAIRRWQSHTCRDAVDASSGELFCDRAKRLAAHSSEASHGQ
jgi:DNA modification methylase